MVLLSEKNCKSVGTNHLYTVCISMLHCKWQGLCFISASHREIWKPKLIYPVDTCCVSGEKLIDNNCILFRICNSYAVVILACCLTLCWIALQTPLAISWSEPSSIAMMGSSQMSLLSWIEFSCLRSAAVGKVARLSIYWQDTTCRLVIPERQVALAQLYKHHHQSGEWQASVKAALGWIFTEGSQFSSCEYTILRVGRGW